MRDRLAGAHRHCCIKPSCGVGTAPLDVVSEDDGDVSVVDVRRLEEAAGSITALAVSSSTNSDTKRTCSTENLVSSRWR